jgi:PB1 domain-containing protein
VLSTHKLATIRSSGFSQVAHSFCFSIPMSGTVVTLKVDHNNDIFRCTFRPPVDIKYDDFARFITSLIGAPAGSPPLSFRFRDRDGDFCRICNNATLREAMQEAVLVVRVGCLTLGA